MHIYILNLKKAMSNRVSNDMSLEDQDIDEDDLAREIMQVQDDNDYEDDYDEIVDGVPEDEAMQLAE